MIDGAVCTPLRPEIITRGDQFLRSLDVAYPIPLPEGTTVIKTWYTGLYTTERILPKWLSRVLQTRSSGVFLVVYGSSNCFVKPEPSQKNHSLRSLLLTTHSPYS